MGVCQSMLVSKVDLTQYTKIHKDLQDGLTVATHRVRWGRDQKVCLCPGVLKDSV